MPRPLRIEYEGAWYHVMNRGANFQPIYLTDYHRKLFKLCLKEVTEKIDIEVHAYCLMDNHYHLLIRTPYANLSKAMRYLDGVYTQRFNLIQKRDGALFRGRYKAILVQEDEYLLHVSRYIHLNPVAANLCVKPEQYLWSSFWEYTQLLSGENWLSREFILNYFNGSQEQYIEYINEGVAEEIRTFYLKKYRSPILGDKEFIERSLEKVTESQKSSSNPDISRSQKLLTLDEVIDVVYQYYNVDKNSLSSSKRGENNLPRKMAIYLCRGYCQVSYRVIAHHFKLIKGRSISQLISRFEVEIASKGYIKKMYMDIHQQLEKLM